MLMDRVICYANLKTIQYLQGCFTAVAFVVVVVDGGIHSKLSLDEDEEEELEDEDDP